MKTMLASAFAATALLCPAQTVQPVTPNQNQPGQQPGNPGVETAPGPAANYPRGYVRGIPGQPQGNIPGQTISPNSDAGGAANPFQTGNFGLDEIQALLQGLQADVEQSVPVIARLISGNQGVDRVTGLPNQLVNSAIANQNPQAYQGIAGTNAVIIDSRTYHQLVVLQNNLQQTLMTLRELNGGPGITTSQNSGQLSPTGFTNRFNRILQNPAQQQQLQQQQLQQPQFQQQQQPNPANRQQPNLPNSPLPNRQLHNPAIQNPATPAPATGSGSGSGR